ncbi:LAMI_0G12640g1_1 [Lachancea mirantina]|uniref:General negative regulator of transcription subunit n=1 Tax=Lachancea mirantina TaxID=1230905 RepID=A0A1G4KBH1_9SACH|nr:LAMI_0G12640g1_1 [Lachancea mirantina]
MAHRKLQQEVDRVFKKISEGLEIFDTYYERHENCTNNPSQRDKLESDLKREVKKLQRLREQIKTWQSSPEIKDKDALLDHRRSVEVAMEKYKAVEKASKEKAYSNISLKKSETLDPQERERRDVTNYLSQCVDELERQYDALQLEVDKLILLNKKKKTSNPANDDKKNKLKELQSRYRWHQQQMELALRLIANEELDPESVKSIQEDINYFVDSNMEPDFVEDETIYDGLNLDANEAIAHEVAASFAAQNNEDSEDEGSRDSTKLSRKEQRKLEREAKKAAKAAAKGDQDITSTVIPSSPNSAEEKPECSSQKRVVSSDISRESHSVSASPSPSPVLSFKAPSTAHTGPSSSGASHGDLGSSGKANESKPLEVVSKPDTLEATSHTHIHQSLNGITTSTLKPATLPVRPAGELKWATAAAQASEKEKKTNALSFSAVANTSNTGSTSNSVSNSVVNTPVVAKLALSNFVTIDKLASSPQSNDDRNDGLRKFADQKEFLGDLSGSKADLRGDLESTLSEFDFSEEDYETEVSEVDFDEEQPEHQLSADELNGQIDARAALSNSLAKDYELLTLPSGIQDFIVSSLLSRSNINNGTSNSKKSAYQAPCNFCSSRIEPIPQGVNPPSPLDAFRSSNQWDLTRASLFDDFTNIHDSDEDKFTKTLEKFRPLETFSLFYSYYFAISPLEHEIAALLLEERNWTVSKSGDRWFLRHGQPKFTSDNCEIADFKIFKLDDWAVVDKLNFKLEYETLKQPPVGFLDISRSQQLLQQLKQGVIGTNAQGVVA